MLLCEFIYSDEFRSSCEFVHCMNSHSSCEFLHCMNSYLSREFIHCVNSYSSCKFIHYMNLYSSCEFIHCMIHTLLARFPISGCNYLSLSLEQRRWQKCYCSYLDDGNVCHHHPWNMNTRVWGLRSACDHVV